MAFCVAYKMVKKMADLSQTVFVLSTNEAYGHTHIHTHGHTGESAMTIGDNATRCILLKNRAYTILKLYRYVQCDVLASAFIRSSVWTDAIVVRMLKQKKQKLKATQYSQILKAKVK